MRDILVAGNWKMNGSTTGNAELVAGIVAGVPSAEHVKLLICPPFPYLAAIAAAAEGSGVATRVELWVVHELGVSIARSESRAWCHASATLAAMSAASRTVTGPAVNRLESGIPFTKSLTI